MEDRHAYLIIAHNNFYILEKLLRLLDDERNDIFLHIDAKIERFNFDYFRSIICRGQLFFADKRIDIRWSSVSQIECELLLFRNALSNGKYKRYHLLSGVDLPLQTQEYIHSICNKNQDVEFLSSGLYSDRKVRYLRLFVEDFKFVGQGVFDRCRWFTKRVIDKLFYIAQRLVGYSAVGDKLGVIYKGSNWVSLTDECVRYIVSEMQEKIKYYKRSHCADEIYKQTLIGNSKFKNRIYADGDLRQIDWTRGQPYTYTKDDFEVLINSSKFFARKFDEKIDIEIVDMIYSHLSKK